MNLNRLFRTSLICGPLFVAACGDDTSDVGDDGDGTTSGSATETNGQVTLTTMPPTTDPTDPDPDTTVGDTTSGEDDTTTGEDTDGTTTGDETDGTTTGDETDGTTTGDTEDTEGETTGGMMLACADQDLGSAVGAAVVTATNDGASDDFEVSCANGDGPDVVYQWTAPETGLFMITTFNENVIFDAAVAIYPADCDGAELACDDFGFGDPYFAAIELDAQQGETFLIVVAGYGGGTGDFVLNINQVPELWTCDSMWYADSIWCDCGCGVVDADCTDATVGSCDFCGEAGSCDTTGGGCPGIIDPVDNATCDISQAWTCDLTAYADGTTCDCGCGLVDPDCDDAMVGSCDECNASGSCAAGETGCDSIDPSNNGVCGGIPAAWTCPESWWDDGDCDCGCGAFDALDCADMTLASCDYCSSGCSNQACAGNTQIDPANNAVCL